MQEIGKEEIQAILGKEITLAFHDVTQEKIFVIVKGKLEKSVDVSAYGYRFRFRDLDKVGNIGLIFPAEAASQLFDKNSINRLHRKGHNYFSLEHELARCPGINGCCQPWNNYLRYFANSKYVKNLVLKHGA